ncbi:hypothetical protein T440DRAFT_539761 [Plenodomus tracheiphilus IPT5]|uniref:Uncharacterized protein n=1 Tax=Plenodomus tracheiphilus IPT5 TaxID=1408161 RepID=A0A6A7AWS0_9PLEO|nr:hypothetical protein T440DRAFT_539761 [Plenodomus tracheiphilus IPT5]
MAESSGNHPDSHPQSGSNIHPANNTQPASNAHPGSNTQSESAIDSDSDFESISDNESESNIQSEPFRVEKKTAQQVKSEAAEQRTSVLTPGLKEHPEQDHLAKRDSAAHMHETPTNIQDGWNSNSVDKEEAESPMGSLTVGSIEKNTNHYTCGFCGESNSPHRETCKKCKDTLGGGRWISRINRMNRSSATHDFNEYMWFLYSRDDIPLCSLVSSTSVYQSSPVSQRHVNRSQGGYGSQMDIYQSGSTIATVEPHKSITIAQNHQNPTSQADPFTMSKFDEESWSYRDAVEHGTRPEYEPKSPEEVEREASQPKASELTKALQEQGQTTPEPITTPHASSSKLYVPPKIANTWRADTLPESGSNEPIYVDVVIEEGKEWICPKCGTKNPPGKYINIVACKGQGCKLYFHYMPKRPERESNVTPPETTEETKEKPFPKYNR